MAPSIAIIGGGPAGLTLARLLQVENVSISITIFEKDSSPTSRTSQGGTLDLHNDTGLAALKKAGLWEEFLKYARYEGEELVLADKNATEYVHMTEYASKDDVYARPEIDREKLKDMLLESVDAKSIQWGKQLKSINAEDRILEFRDGSTAGPFDLVVGADGAWSKVRPVLTDVKPHYSGVCGFSSNIEKPNEEYPKISKMVGRGSYFAYSDCKGMNAQRMGNESIKVSNWVLKEEGYPAKILAEVGVDEAGLKEKILSQYLDWAPEMQDWVKVSTSFQPWTLFELPVGHTWEHKKGFTMIGDAAHLMTPFAGEGVNAAMKDALELSILIASSQKPDDTTITNDPSSSSAIDALDAAVHTNETNMFPRAKDIQTHTMLNKKCMFRADAPISFMLRMVDVVSEKSGYNLDKGFMAWIPLRSAVFAYFSTVGMWGSCRIRMRKFFYKT